MGYRCLVKNAVPIVGISTHDNKGVLLPKPTTSTKCVKMGQVVTWVDRCSRKHFIATDDATKKRDAKDFEEMKAELRTLDVDVPDDVTFAECADSLAAINAVGSGSSTPNRRFLVPRSTAKSEVAGSGEDITSVLKQLDALGVSYHPNIGLEKAKRKLAESR